ncbi:hypothetical protein AB0P21_10770 [Kribbella sp. NPDC056861]|uniref:hypothetical protein n=1 Tax=Kribbella sp. NPDC056861 TaxID=3154857 RepID=UPI003431C113
MRRPPQVFQQSPTLALNPPPDTPDNLSNTPPGSPPSTRQDSLPTKQPDSLSAKRPDTWLSSLSASPSNTPPDSLSASPSNTPPDSLSASPSNTPPDSLSASPPSTPPDSLPASPSNTRADSPREMRPSMRPDSRRDSPRVDAGMPGLRVPDSEAQAQPTEEAMGVTNDEPAPSPANPWHPPWWLLAFAPFCWLLIGALVLSHRGWPTALATAALLAPLGMPIPAVLRLIKRHPHLAGVYVAPLTFVATILLTDLPLWLCTAATVAATLLALLITTIRAFSQAE